MSLWGDYNNRIDAVGKTRRERALKATQRKLTKKVPYSLSAKQVIINGEERTLTVLNREDLDEKRIVALPGETIPHGGLIDFADNKWLVTELDASDEVYASALMKQCNYIVRWINDDGNIIEKWCIIEDGTKYLIGENVKEAISVGAARFALTVGKDEDTIHIKRGMRFLVYDNDCDDAVAFEITKTNTMYNNYNGNGIFRFIMVESNITDDDNIDLLIADYYKKTKREINEEIEVGVTTTDEHKRGVWL